MYSPQEIELELVPVTLGERTFGVSMVKLKQLSVENIPLLLEKINQAYADAGEQFRASPYADEQLSACLLVDGREFIPQVPPEFWSNWLKEARANDIPSQQHYYRLFGKPTFYVVAGTPDFEGTDKLNENLQTVNVEAYSVQILPSFEDAWQTCRELLALAHGLPAN